MKEIEKLTFSVLYFMKNIKLLLVKHVTLLDPGSPYTNPFQMLQFNQTSY